MKFLVKWQTFVYDAFNKLKEIKTEPLFEISAISLDLAKERVEAQINRVVITRMGGQTSQQKKEMIVGKIIALIDESGVRHQFSER